MIFDILSLIIVSEYVLIRKRAFFIERLQIHINAPKFIIFAFVLHEVPNRDAVFRLNREVFRKIVDKQYVFYVIFGVVQFIYKSQVFEVAI